MADVDVLRSAGEWLCVSATERGSTLAMSSGVPGASLAALSPRAGSLPVIDDRAGQLPALDPKADVPAPAFTVTMLTSSGTKDGEMLNFVDSCSREAASFPSMKVGFVEVPELPLIGALSPVNSNASSSEN